MSRSRASALFELSVPSDLPRTVRKSPTERRSSRAVTCLATVPPRDRNAERDMQSAKGGGHNPDVPGRRSENRQRAGEHKANSHDRYDSHREGATRDDCGAVEEKPHP